MTRTAFTYLLLLVVSNISCAASGTNLLVNGNAETGDTTGWDASGGMEVTTATGMHAGFGSFTFTGGSYIGDSEPVLKGMTQTIDLTSFGAAIDAGKISYTFSVQLQSRFTNIANALLDFYRSDNSLITRQRFYDSTALDVFEWEELSASDTVPLGTRTVQITLLANKSVGDLSPPLDAFFDEAYFSILDISKTETRRVPFPSIVLLLLATLLVLRIAPQYQH